MRTTAVRNLFTEHEDHLTADMPELVAVGFVNARRKDGKGEWADQRLVVAGDHVYTLPAGGSLDGYDVTGNGIGNLFASSRFGFRR